MTGFLGSVGINDKLRIFQDQLVDRCVLEPTMATLGFVVVVTELLAWDRVSSVVVFKIVLGVGTGRFLTTGPFLDGDFWRLELELLME